MTLIESAKLNGHDPWAYLKNVFERLPTLKQRDLKQLLPHNWRPASHTAAPRCRSKLLIQLAVVGTNDKLG